MTVLSDRPEQWSDRLSSQCVQAGDVGSKMTLRTSTHPYPVPFPGFGWSDLSVKPVQVLRWSWFARDAPLPVELVLHVRHAPRRKETYEAGTVGRRLTQRASPRCNAARWLLLELHRKRGGRGSQLSWFGRCGRWRVAAGLTALFAPVYLSFGRVGFSSSASVWSCGVSVWLIMIRVSPLVLEISSARQ